MAALLDTHVALWLQGDRFKDSIGAFALGDKDPFDRMLIGGRRLG